MAPKKERRFRIRNISGRPGVTRTIIPYGGASTLPPSTHRRRKPRRKPGRHTAVIAESELRRLVGLYRAGQMSVEAMDGLPLPSWLASDTPAKVVKEAVEEKKDEEPEKEAVEEAKMEKRGVVSPSDMTVSELEAWAEGQDLDSLKAALQLEADSKGRKTALQALQDRIEELS